MEDKGSYVLLISLITDTTIEIGKLGQFHFTTGYYLYCGSALNGLSRRIHRHLRSEKKLHWHIDYLLSYSKIVEVWAVRSEEWLECRLAEASVIMPGSIVPVNGFGSSDCGCRSHLFYFAKRPDMQYFQTGLCGGITPERIPMDG